MAEWESEKIAGKEKRKMTRLIQPRLESGIVPLSASQSSPTDSGNTAGNNEPVEECRANALSQSVHSSLFGEGTFIINTLISKPPLSGKWKMWLHMLSFGGMNTDCVSHIFAARFAEMGWVTDRETFTEFSASDAEVRCLPLSPVLSARLIAETAMLLLLARSTGGGTRRL
ncbi:hypothetical protein SKAU_G00400730 [Synaphobranchus kaupii]|uniref:Uncharacterized protein n=1 Tax=Synaphobranchus kaupii TaxID=118154 RepID=A0A9Q1E911_SYNKA|nr:hypothetical protein SKAU_G00400730 [Synaphobranchus kaupii]